VSRARVLYGALIAVILAAAVLPVSSGVSVGETVRAAPRATVAKAHWRPDAAVRAIVVSRTRVYIAGDFTHLRNRVTQKTVRRTRVAAFKRSNGALIARFHPRVNGSVDALALFGRKLVIGGDFSSINGHVRQSLGAVKGRSGELTPWQATVDGPVRALLSMGGRVYVGGDFEHVNGMLRTYLFALDGRAALSSTWPTQEAGTTDKRVYSLAASVDHLSVLVGGAFETLAGSPRTYLGEISSEGGQVTDWNPAPLCENKCFVTSLVANRARIYAGIAGPGGAVAAYRGDTGALRWKRHANGTVEALALAGKHLILGGHFTSVAHHERRMFAALQVRDGKVTRRAPASSGNPFPGILALDFHDHRIRMGGGFSSIAGQVRYAVLPE